jgi:cation:H+ antiporter
MPDGFLVLVFVVSAMLSLGSSWVLVTRLERVGARLGLSEALLGMLAALAADAPEITAAVTALVGHQSRIGAGVVIGSNVFNLAALLGLSAVLAGGIALHRRVIVMEGFVAMWIAAVCVAVIVGALSPAAGLIAVLCVLVPYFAVLSGRRDQLRRLGLPARWVSWLTDAVLEEELELEVAIHPSRGHAADVAVAAAAVLVVVGASLAMEQAASTFGTRNAIPEIVVGGLILAAVTSLPNAVAAVYLASRGRGTATLSTAMNSNALNVAAGLLLPGTIVGLGASTGPATLVAAWYFGLTALALACAYMGRGLRRWHGALIIGAYVAFVGTVLGSAYASPAGVLLSAAVPAAGAIAFTAWRMLSLGPRRSGPVAGDGVGPNPRDASVITGGPIRAIWCTALASSAVVAATDAALGHHVILISLLIVGPCCALLTGRWERTAAAGAWAVALGVLLGLPDGIWGTWMHLAFLGPVIAVTLVSTVSAALIERYHWRGRDSAR